VSGSLAQRKVAALVRLAGEDRDAILALLGPEAPPPDDLDLDDPEAEEAVLEEILRLATAPPARPAPRGTAKAAATSGSAPPAGAAPAPAGAAQTSSAGGAGPGDGLDQVSPRRFAQFLGEEHPQTVALVLASWPPKRAGAVLQELDPALRVDTLTRMAKLDALPAGPLHRALEALRQKMRSSPVETVERSSGVRLAADLLKEMGRAKATEILTALATREPQLAERVEQCIYTFEDLARLSAADARKLVPRLDRKALATALAACPENVKELILASMSQGMREGLKEEMEYGGVKRLAEIQAAQRDIVQAALQLDADGEIRFAKGDEA
jgi:flagellar motor switch protein FliG